MKSTMNMKFQGARFAALLCLSLLSMHGFAQSGADLSSSVQSSPTSVSAGSNVSLIARASNGGPATASNVSLQVGLPNGTLGNRFVFQSATGAGWQCSFNGGSNQVNCLLSGTLATGTPSAPVTILARTPTVGGVYTTTAFATSQAPDDNPGNNGSSVDTTVVGAPNADLGVSMSVPSSAELGDMVSGTATIQNIGPGEAASHEVRVTIPSFFSNVTVSGGGYACSGGSGTFTCLSSANLASGTSRTINFSGRASSGGSGNFQVEARNCSCIDSNLANNTVTRAISIFGSAPNVQITKTVSASSVVVGQEFAFTLTVRNSDSRPAQRVVVNDSLPNNASLVGTSTTGGFVCSGSGVLSCAISGPLSAGGVASVLIRMRALSFGTINNTAQLVVGDYGVVATANASIAAVLPSSIDLAATKTASVSEVRRAQRMSFNLGVSNAQGADSASNVRIVDTLPDGFTFESASGANWTCAGATVVTCSYSVALAGGASSAVTITVLVDAAAALGPRTNSIRVSAQENEPVQTNNSAQASVTVVSDVVLPLADLAASAQFSVASAQAGDRLALNLTMQNLGGGSVPAGASISGSLPSDLLASSAPSGCSITGQVLNCVASTAIAPLGSALFSIPINVGSTLTGLPRTVSATFISATSVPDSNPGNNSAVATLRLESTVVTPTIADLGLTLSPATSTVAASANLAFNATVTNAGPATATALRLSLTLPAGFTAGSSSGTFQCSGGPVVVCTLGTLPLNVSASVVVNATASAIAGTFTVAASLSAATTDSALGNNQANAQVIVQAGAIGGDLGTLLGPLVTNPIAQRALAPIAAGCARPDFTLRDVCDALADAARRGDRTGIEDTLRAIAPEEVLVQARAINEIGIAQFENVNARMSELRGGGGGFSASNLTFISGNEVIPVGMLAGLVASAADDAEGGTEGLVSPWGLFVNGVIQRGSRDASASETGFDFNTHAITVGVDYRFSDKLAGGGAIGSSKFSSEYGGGGVLDTTALTFTGYASYYYSDTGYVDSRVSLGSANFEQTRPILIRLGSLAENRFAVADTDATQFTMAFASGRHFQVKRLNVTPNVSLKYMRTNIDGFTESGADRFNLSFVDQTVDSLTFTGGVSASRPISTSRGVITPQFDFNVHHEFKNDGMTVEARLIGARPDEIFFLRGDAPDRDYASMGLGLVWVGAQGRQAYLTYRTLFGLDRTERNTINLGARFEF